MIDTKDKEIERLKDDNKYLNKVNIELSSEKNRLKSIINELEKWVKSEYDRYYNDKENLVFSNVEVIDFSRVLGKIKELKGSDKE